MNNYFKILYAVITVLVLLITACDSGQNRTQSTTALNQEELIKRGEYLVNTSGCDDCHSPKMMGPHGPEVNPELRFSGHPSDLPLPKVDKAVLENWVLFNHTGTATVGPWGASFAGNISSDDSGIGLWSEDQFINALRHGKLKGMENGRSMLPPMPWPVYAQMSDDDLKAIFAYLKSTKPVRNIVPQPIPYNELGN